MTPHFSVIMPIHNQADHLNRLVAEALRVMKAIGGSFELLFVVNNSTDDSFNICTELAKKHPDNLRVLFSDKGGWGRAVRLGIKEAKGHVLCYTNSARTSPEVLQEALKISLANPFAVIKASRRVRSKWLRRLGSVIYNLQLRVLLDLGYWDINGTPKVFSRKHQALFKAQEDGDLFDAEFMYLCRRENYSVIELHISEAGRFGGKSTTNYLSAIKMYIGAFRLWLRVLNT